MSKLRLQHLAVSVRKPQDKVIDSGHCLLQESVQALSSHS